MQWWCRLAAVVVLLAGVAHAAPVKVRYPETTTQGWVELTDLAGKVLGHGELTQWHERGAVANRLVIHFADGSLFDEQLRFSQHGVFRLLSYHLVQRGPSFTTSSDVQFDRSGRYRARRRTTPDADEETAAGTIAIPDDVANGMMSTLLRNLPAGASASAHLLAFTPQAIVLDLHLTPEGSDAFAVGDFDPKATRYLAEPKVPGLKGVVAKMIGKDPPSVRYWITSGRTPVFVRFEGPLYADGPPWRIEQAAPRWKP
jgi:hypothetical protein